jgi:hypothetical protein
MQPNQPSKQLIILICGDLITLALVTVFGFATHGTAGSAGARMLTTFLPLAAAWLLVAPLMGVFDTRRAAVLSQLWRPFYAMIIAGPFAAWMRGAWLNAPILPVFVVVLGGVSALSILAWRLFFALVLRRKSQ